MAVEKLPARVTTELESPYENDEGADNSNERVQLRDVIILPEEKSSDREHGGHGVGQDVQEGAAEIVVMDVPVGVRRVVVRMIVVMVMIVTMKRLVLMLISMPVMMAVISVVQNQNTQDIDDEAEAGDPNRLIVRNRDRGEQAARRLR